MYELRVPVIFTGKIEDVEKFLSRNQDPVMIRERKIDEIVLNRKDMTPIRLRTDIYGSTYQSPYRTKLDLKSVSHRIISIEIEENNIYGTIKILGTPMGKPISSSMDTDPSFLKKIILRPVYGFYLSALPGTAPPSPEIDTFDIDFIQ
jgi:hypothetical protein